MPTSIATLREMSESSDSRLAESAVMAAQIAVADRIARVLVECFSVTSEAGWPLSELQRVELIKTALLEFDGFEAELTRMLEIERQLNELGLDGSNGHR